MVKTYRPKDRDVQAAQWTGDLQSANEIIRWAERLSIPAEYRLAEDSGFLDDVLVIKQFDTEVVYVHKDWWLAFDGTWFQAYDPHYFPALFEEVEEDPRIERLKAMRDELAAMIDEHKNTLLGPVLMAYEGTLRALNYALLETE
jgi:hypothetical protein